MWLVRTTAGHFTEPLLNLASVTETCSALEKSWKKVYLRATTKSVSLFQPEHGFCQKNVLDWGQTPNAGLIYELKNGGGTRFFRW